MKRFSRMAGAVSAIVLLTLAPATRGDAARPATACGQTITTDWVLLNDVGPCPGNGIIVGADNITLNLGDHRIIGNFDRGANGEFAAIRLPFRTGVTVTGKKGVATVEGFEAGVVINGGSRNEVKHLTAQDNVGSADVAAANLGDGIAVLGSEGNLITGNVLRRNGVFDGVGVIGAGANNNNIDNNVIEENFGPGTEGHPLWGSGVALTPDGAPGVSLTGNRVANNLIRANDLNGIGNLSDTNGVYEGNTILDNTRGPTARALLIGAGIRVERDHHAGATADMRVTIRNNEVHGNGAYGIRLGVFALSNRVSDNDARGNGNVLSEGFGKDLNDNNPGCTNGTLVNIWERNLYVTATVFPPFFPNFDCVTGGLPPTPWP